MSYRYVDFDTWPEPLWPQCCFGPAYLMTPEVIGKIINAHEEANNPFLPFEDIYVTGVLARAAGVSIINFPEKVFTNYLGKERFIIHRGLSHWKPEYINERWEDISIAYFGNFTYQKMKREEREKSALSKKEILVKELVEKRRKEFFERKRKSNGDIEQKVLKNAPKQQKKREEALKKPIQPYML